VPTLLPHSKDSTIDMTKVDNNATSCLLSLQSMFRLNVARFRSLTTETSSTIVHRMSPTHQISDALERNTPGQPVQLRVSKIIIR